MSCQPFHHINNTIISLLILVVFLMPPKFSAKSSKKPVKSKAIIKSDEDDEDDVPAKKLSKSPRKQLTSRMAVVDSEVDDREVDEPTTRLVFRLCILLLMFNSFLVTRNLLTMMMKSTSFHP